MDPLRSNLSLRNSLWTSHYQYKYLITLTYWCSRSAYTSIIKSPTSFLALSFSSIHILKGQNTELMGLWVNSNHQTYLMQYFILTATESSCIWWPFCIEVLSQRFARRMFMRTGNRVDSKVVHPVTWEKGSKDQAIQGIQGTGRVVPPLSGGRTSGLRWREVVSPNFPRIPEAHLPALTVHDGSLISAVWWSQRFFMLQLLSLAIHCHSSCPYINSFSFFFPCLRTN